MNNEDFDIRSRCPGCDAPVTTTIETERFPYGVDGPDQVILEATVPVRHCAACGLDYTDYEGEDARDAAVRAHLGRILR